jgi:hypothetical protein
MQTSQNGNQRLIAELVEYHNQCERRVSGLKAEISNAKEICKQYRENIQRTRFQMSRHYLKDKTILEKRRISALVCDALHCFQNNSCLKFAKQSYDIVNNVGGLVNLQNILHKAQLIKNKKVDVNMLEYKDVLSTMSMNVGSIVLIEWKGGGKSFVKIVEQWKPIKCSTTICFTFLVRSRCGQQLYMTIPYTQLYSTSVLCNGNNVQQLFDELCKTSNIDKLYHTNHSKSRKRGRYNKEEFKEAFIRESYDGINACPGLANLIYFEAKSEECKTVDEQPCTDDNEVKFVKDVSLSERDEEGYKNAIVLT